jgi:Flp pilus assembly protein TadD
MPVAIIGFVLVGGPLLVTIHRGWRRYLWARAIWKQQEYVAAHPDDVEAFHQLGFMAASRGWMDLANDAFNRAVSLNPRHAPSLVGQAHVLAMQGDLSTALHHAQQASEYDPELFAAHFAVGTIYQDMEQHARAITALEKALTIDPEDGPTLLELARCHYVTGSLQKAQTLLDQARLHGASDPQLVRAVEEGA